MFEEMFMFSHGIEMDIMINIKEQVNLKKKNLKVCETKNCLFCNIKGHRFNLLLCLHQQKLVL